MALNGLGWEVGGRDGEAMGRAEAPPLFDVQPFILQPGSACCLKHRQCIRVNETNSSEAHLRVFTRCFGPFIFGTNA